MTPRGSCLGAGTGLALRYKHHAHLRVLICRVTKEMFYVYSEMSVS